MVGFTLEIPKHRELTGGDLLAQSLKALGIKVAFGLHGGHLDAFLVGCEDIGIRLIDTRHETAALQAAEGYSKVTGTVGTCFVTANSGFSNGLPGLATAFADRSSILCITSSAPLRDAESNCLQGTHDQVVVAKNVTKFAHRVAQVEEIPRLVAHAFRVSVAGAPGPVLVDFPIDILFSPIQQHRISWGAIVSPLPYPPGPNSNAVAEAISLLKASKRPVIISGTGARSAEATSALQTFAEATNTPIFHCLKYSSTLPWNHPLNGGVANLLAYLPVLRKSPPDLIILLGARTGMFLGGRGGSILPKSGCKFIQVDTDGGEIGRALPIDLGIVSDVEQFLLSLIGEVRLSSFRAADEWVATATGLKHIPSPHDKEPEETTPGRPHPHHALKEVFSSLEPGTIICIDGGDCGSWAAGLVQLSQPHLVLFAPGYMGFLGNGFGYALGCAIAEPSRKVVNIHGDGSAGFHLAELDTYARFKLNILTIVVNNYAWGMSSNGQDLIYGSISSARPVSSLSPKTAYEVVARGFGNTSARVDKVADVEKAIKDTSSAEGPGCINLIVSNKPTHPGTVAMVSHTDDPNIIVVPYYDNIPRPFYKD